MLTMLVSNACIVVAQSRWIEQVRSNKALRVEQIVSTYLHQQKDLINRSNLHAELDPSSKKWIITSQRSIPGAGTHLLDQWSYDSESETLDINGTCIDLAWAARDVNKFIVRKCREEKFKDVTGDVSALLFLKNTMEIHTFSGLCVRNQRYHKSGLVAFRLYKSKDGKKEKVYLFYNPEKQEIIWEAGAQKKESKVMKIFIETANEEVIKKMKKTGID